MLPLRGSITPARRPMSAKTEMSPLLKPNAAVARKFFPAQQPMLHYWRQTLPFLETVFPHRRAMSGWTEISSLLAQTIPSRGILVPAMLSTAFLLQVVLTICLTNGEFACFVEVDHVRTRRGSQGSSLAFSPDNLFPSRGRWSLLFGIIAPTVFVPASSPTV